MAKFRQIWSHCSLGRLISLTHQCKLCPSLSLSLSLSLSTFKTLTHRQTRSVPPRVERERSILAHLSPVFSLSLSLSLSLHLSQAKWVDSSLSFYSCYAHIDLVLLILSLSVSRKTSSLTRRQFIFNRAPKSCEKNCWQGPILEKVFAELALIVSVICDGVILTCAYRIAYWTFN